MAKRLLLILSLLLGLSAPGQAQQVFDPINSFLTNAHFGGVTSLPDGSTWGQTGAGLAPSSFFNFQDGSAWSSSGLAMSPLSQARFSDGSIWNRYGVLFADVTTVRLPDGSLWTPIGLQVNPAHSIRLGDGTTLTGSGSTLSLVSGTAAAPSLRFYTHLTRGIFNDTTLNGVGVTVAGAQAAAITAAAIRGVAGSSSAPSVTDLTNGNAGLYFPATHQLGLRGQLTHADGGTAPTITADCGTSPSIVGTNNVMLITVGTGGTATSCTVTFGTSYTNAPICTANSNTDKVGLSVAPTTTTVVVAATAAFTASSKLNLLCFGRV